MTLHREFQTDSSETVDILIRIALRESVAGAEPPPRVWGRIKERMWRLALARQFRDEAILIHQPILPPLVRASMLYLFADHTLRIC
jgi:hypothetical protein